MRVLLDTNVVLDLLLNRTPWEKEAAAIAQAGDEKRLTVAVTVLSIANVSYVARRQVGEQRAKDAVGACLQAFEVLPVDRASIEIAYRLPGRDLEDNIQIAVAVQCGQDAIVTRDSAGFAVSMVRVLTPAQLLAELGISV